MLLSSTAKDENEVQEVLLNRTVTQPNSSVVADRLTQQLDYLVDLIATEQAEAKDLRSPVNAGSNMPVAEETTAQAQTVISLILCCRNQAASLRDQLQRAQQALAKIPGIHEIILVDGARHAASVSIARELNIRLVVSPTSQLGMMRTIGVRNSQGSLLAFADVQNLSALEDLPQHFAHLNKGCDLVQSGSRGRGSDDTNDIGRQSSVERIKSIVRQTVCAGIESLSKLIAGAKFSQFSCSLQSVRRTSWEQYRLTEVGESTRLELPLRCRWLNGEIVEFSGSQATEVGMTRRSLKRLIQAVRLTMLQRPDRALTVPAMVTFVAALAINVWAIASSRLLGPEIAMLWIGSSSAAMLAAAMWMAAGWVATEYARQKNLLPQDYRRTRTSQGLRAKTSLVIGTVLILVGSAMMILGSYVSGCYLEAALNGSQSMMSLIQWIWPGATLTLIGHQLSMVAILKNWFLRQPLR